MRSILLIALFIVAVSSFELAKLPNGQSRLLGKICPVEEDSQNPTQFADPFDCHNFYKCDNGVPVLRRCPSGLWWSSAANRCEHTENSDCGNPEAPESAEPESNESASEEEVEGPSELPEGCPADDDPQNPTHLPDPTNCRRFYKCDNGVPVLRRCAAHLWWSSAANRCEHQENSDCGNPGGSIPTEAPESAEPEPNESESDESESDEEVEGPSELPEGCPADDDPQNPTLLPDPTDCRRFYKCDNGVPVLRRCAAHLWWSSAANRCEHHENSDCGNPGGSIPTEAPESAEPESIESESDESGSDEEVEGPSELPEGCPADDDPQNPTLLPDPTDCRRFYKCDHGVPVLRRCAAHLWWSSAANRCEHHENSDCGNPGGSIPTEAPESAEPESIESESDESGSDEEVEGPSELPEGCPADDDPQNPTLLPDTTDCRRFYKCDHGVPVLRRCPADLWWSSAANRCEHHENSDCGNPGGSIPTEAPESAEPESIESESDESGSDEEVEGPSELPEGCPADDDPQNPTLLPDPTDCRRFYKCDNGVPVLRRCPADLWWSSAANRCEHHENSDCGNPGGSIPTEAPESAEPESIESESDESVSDEEVEGPSELPEGCPADDDPQNPTLLPDPTDCRRFYKCDHGVPVLRRCPADLWWSSAANRCEHHENSDCGNPGGSIPTEAPESAEPEPNESESDESVSDEEVEGPSELPEGCPADDDPQNPTLLPDPTDCRRFYKCDHGVPVLRRCPADLWWSSAANRCEHHENSDCGNPGGSIPTEAPESAEPESIESESDESGSDEEVEGPSELPEGCPADDDPQNPTLLPDPTDCRRFYKCDHGVPVLRRCPADLWWSSAANRCEHQENSDCGNTGGIIVTEAPESAEPEPNESESDEEVEGPSELPEGCPADDDPQNPTLLPDPTDCRRFYKCDHGVPVLRRCAAHLWWSSAANRCEHQENSDCGNPGGNIPTEAPESAEPEPNESESDESESDEEVEGPSELPEGCPADDDPQNPTLLPDPTDCRRFYKCDNGVPVLRRCAAHLWWSSAANRCEHQENSDCGNTGGSIVTEAPESVEPEPNESGSDEEVGPSELPEGCPADEDPRNPTHLADPTDCHRFYKCDNGVPVLRRCTSNLWWSSAANRCEHQENSDCGNPGGSIVTEAPESAEPELNESGSDEEVGPSELPEGCPTDEDPRNPTHLPDPTDCHRFYKCDHGVPVLRRCTSNLWWSSAANRCEHHENSDCASK